MKSADKSADTKTGESLPGTLWKCHGAWHWRVTLPGAEKRLAVHAQRVLRLGQAHDLENLAVALDGCVRGSGI